MVCKLHKSYKQILIWPVRQWILLLGCTELLCLRQLTIIYKIRYSVCTSLSIKESKFMTQSDNGTDVTTYFSIRFLNRSLVFKSSAIHTKKNMLSRHFSACNRLLLRSYVSTIRNISLVLLGMWDLRNESFLRGHWAIHFIIYNALAAIRRPFCFSSRLRLSPFLT